MQVTDKMSVVTIFCEAIKSIGSKKNGCQAYKKNGCQAYTVDKLNDWDIAI